MADGTTNTPASVLSDLRSAKSYVLTSDYAVLWVGKYAEKLNKYNKYVETISIPGKNISTGDSTTANSLKAKIAQDLTFEDFELTWRVTRDFEVWTTLGDWMKEVKEVEYTGGQGTNVSRLKTGYFDDYCVGNSCKIGIQEDMNKSPVYVCEIKGMYPVAIQAMQFSAEGGEYIKLTSTFSCYNVINLIGKQNQG